MAQPRRADIRDKDLHGLNYFRLVGPLLERLQGEAVGITTLILPPVKNYTARGLDVVLHLLQCS